MGTQLAARRGAVNNDQINPLESSPQSRLAYRPMHTVITELGRLTHNPNPGAVNALSLVDLIHEELVSCHATRMSKHLHTSLKNSIDTFDLDDLFWLTSKSEENKEYLQMFREALTLSVDSAFKGDQKGAMDRLKEGCTLLEIILD